MHPHQTLDMASLKNVLQYVFPPDGRHSFVLYFARIIIAFLSSHNITELINDAPTSNLKNDESKILRYATFFRNISCTLLYCILQEFSLFLWAATIVVNQYTTHSH